MDADLEFDDSFDSDDVEIEEEEGTPKKGSPLRIILLVLVVLILLCVVCYLGSSFLGSGITSQIQSLVAGTEGTVIAPVDTVIPVDTPASIPTDETSPEQPDQPSPVEPAPTDESALPPETDNGEEPAPPQITEEPETPVEQPTEETPAEPGDPTATTAPVPGPTATPTLETGPTVVITPVNCDNNTPPIATANGPYTGMMGKGQAHVTFDAGGSNDPDGMIVDFVWDFGDGSEPDYGPLVTHGYANPGKYTATLTVVDNCEATSQDTAEVTISGPTPPAGTITPAPGKTPTPTSTALPPPDNITLGFCYIVQYGDTLSGISWYYGVSLQDMAAVNNVSPDYFVKLGEGLFIPYGSITEGANGYQVQYDDTIQSVAYQCAVSPAVVAEANDIPVDTTLTPGDIIIIPIGRY